MQATALLEGGDEPDPLLRSRDLLFSGRAYARLGYFWKAGQKVQEAFEQDKDLLVALYNLACYQNRGGSPDLAIATLEYLATNLTKKPDRMKKKFFDLAQRDADLKNLHTNPKFKIILKSLKTSSRAQ